MAALALTIIDFLLQPAHALPDPPPGMDRRRMQLGQHAMQLMMKKQMGGMGGMMPMPMMGMMGMPPVMGMTGGVGDDKALALACVRNLSEIGMVEAFLEVTNGGKSHDDDSHVRRAPGRRRGRRH